MVAHVTPVQSHHKRLVWKETMDKLFAILKIVEEKNGVNSPEWNRYLA